MKQIQIGDKIQVANDISFNSPDGKLISVPKGEVMWVENIRENLFENIPTKVYECRNNRFDCIPIDRKDLFLKINQGEFVADIRKLYECLDSVLDELYDKDRSKSVEADELLAQMKEKYF